MTSEAARARAGRELAGFTPEARRQACIKRQIGTMLAIAALELIAGDGPDSVTATAVATKAVANLKVAVPGVATATDFPPVVVALKAVAPATLDHLKRLVSAG
ncbi:hypothetical protein SAMN07250955_101452 [Arboricoccus pini]|uniref:Uncharacterized protein n=1 Tax=Arboricoccus pini TaxID=1963835 RepID=A0A212Q6U7_9PROT|nr:hypothetical protein [Arboricoccus pini]SNB55014.1 hypothetical protein SAMN07250955_101452 [Arboricoccus pini]